MLIIAGRSTKLSPTLRQMYAGATVRLTVLLREHPSRQVGAPMLDRLSFNQRVTTLLLVARDAVSPSKPTLFPTIWNDAAVVATFSFVADVLANRVPGHLDQHEAWERTIRRNCRDQSSKDKTRSLSQRLLAVRNRYLTAQWQIKVGRGRAKGPLTWQPLRTSNSHTPPAFWDAPPPALTEEELPDIETAVEQAAAPVDWLPSTKLTGAEESIDPGVRMVRRVRI